MKKGEINTIWLDLWDEFVGVLKGLGKDDSTFRVSFEGCRLIFNLDSEEAKIAQKILHHNLIGQKIGLLRTDIPGKPILVRIIAN
jgi:hypothetical protein